MISRLHRDPRMMRCIYTAQKHKKLKTWLDGFVRIRGRKLLLYDVDRTGIDSCIGAVLDNEMETAKHMIYVEDFEDSSEDVCGAEDNPKREKTTDREAVSGNKPTAALVVTEDADTVPKGRTNEEVIDLFK